MTTPRCRTILSFSIMLALAAPLLAAPAGKAPRHTTRPPAATQPAAQAQTSVLVLLNQPIKHIALDNVPAKQAFTWWSHTTGIPLIIDWKTLADQGIDPTQPVTLKLHHLPARVVLHLLMQQTSPPVGITSSLIADANSYFVQIMTKAQANREPVVRIYPVMDLIFLAPPVRRPPNFNLQTALQTNNYSGGGGGNNQGLFGNPGQNNRQNQRLIQTQAARQKQIETLQNILRQSIEPKAWHANGGTVAFMTYHQGLLIVRAPRYIQAQVARVLGGPWRGLTPPPLAAAAAAARTHKAKSAVHKSNVPEARP